MKVWLEVQRRSGIDKRNVRPDGRVGIATGQCPACNVRPFRIMGGNLRRHDDRAYIANGRCVDCGEAVGYIYHRPSTIFGIEEDQRVLHGRARVY